VVLALLAGVTLVATRPHEAPELTPATPAPTTFDPMVLRIETGWNPDNLHERAPRTSTLQQVIAYGDETGIHKLWARQKIAGLMDRLREGTDRGEVRSAVVAVALQHHLVSAYTSLVAVDVTPTRPEESPSRTANVPVTLPAGMVYEKVFGGLPKTATPAPLYLALGLASLALARCVFRRACQAGGAR